MLTDPKAVAFVGDWHENHWWGVSVIDALAGKCDAIVHCGDFGYKFSKPFLLALQKALEEADIELYFVDGNHEDFDWLLQQPVTEDGTLRMPKYANRIHYLPRGYRWQWWGKTWLAMGGAHSVDRRWRSPHKSWWWQETIKPSEQAKAIADGPADIMVTHDCPDKVDIPGLNASANEWPADEIQQAEYHRAILGEIVDAVQPELLVHGHYHRFYTSVRETTGTRIVGLNFDGTDHTNVWLVNPDTIER